MMELPSNATISTYSQVDADWISSSVDCTKNLFQSKTDRYLHRFALKVIDFFVYVTFLQSIHWAISTALLVPAIEHLENQQMQQFIQVHRYLCNNTSFPDISQSVGIVEDDGTSFFIYVNGYPESDIVVLRNDQDNIVECAHTLLPPENPLTYATGGVLTAPPGVHGEAAEPVAVICGGQFDLNDNKYIANEKCLILSASKPAVAVVNDNPGSQNQTIYKLSGGGFLNNFRVGSVSAVVDNGRMLWVLGGKDNTCVKRDTEFVVVSTGNHSAEFPTNAAGPYLPPIPEFSVDRALLAHHCFEKVTGDIAIMTGGTPFAYDNGK